MADRLANPSSTRRALAVAAIGAASTLALAWVLVAWDGSGDSPGAIELLGVWVVLGLATGWVGRSWLALLAPLAGAVALLAYGAGGERYGTETWVIDLAIVRTAEAVAVAVGVRIARRR